VINFTNPMTMCLQALYEGFNEIKAYGNCHEVFGTQILLAEIYNEQNKEKKATKADIKITVSGINHFTWITQASCFGESMFPLYENFLKMNKNPEYEKEPDSWKEMYPFGSLGKVKYDLYDRFKCMAAAEDRHLAEFMPVSYYLKDETTRNKFKFHLTPVSFRIEQRKCAVEDTKKLICHETDLEINESGEEGLSQLKALCGLKSLVTNINHINLGQALGLPKGQIVETNALFSYDKVEPIQAEKLPLPVEAMVKRHMEGHRMILESYRKKDLRYGLYALVNDPACGHLNFEEIQSLFDELVDKMGFYLDPYKQ
ncbi:MAG: alpha-glucosidase/alpha-galactosidase, partial [Acholeplasmataceae bacterium]|nr:alpha-glucosidase/alpha-galactosidase [Acholeplasmataceae bacterium]